MGKTAEDVGSRFVLALGDNFYWRGVTSASDPLWDEVWKSRFTAPALQTPWYALMGNHDHYGNAQAQIDYSLEGRDKRWTLPNYYWSQVKTFGPPGSEVRLQLVMIDTVILDEAYTRSTLVEKIRKGLLPAHYLEMFDARTPDRAQAGEAQIQWLNEVLASSTADWLLVAGHYPVYSGGEHGTTRSLVEQLKPLLERYRVDAYLAGHDHTAQHLYENGVNYYVMGNGCLLGTMAPLPQTVYGAVMPGYAAHQVTASSLTTTWLDYDGAPLYAHTLARQRVRRPIGLSP